MWIILIIAALVAFIWLTEPKSEQLPVKCYGKEDSHPGNESPAGGISRLFDL